jgi:hypothetical protein
MEGNAVPLPTTEGDAAVIAVSIELSKVISSVSTNALVHAVAAVERDKSDAVSSDVVKEGPVHTQEQMETAWGGHEKLARTWSTSSLC